jgi:hypothetical protein
MYKFDKAAETPHEPPMTLCFSETTAVYCDGENHAFYRNVSLFITLDLAGGEAGLIVLHVHL